MQTWVAEMSTQNETFHFVKYFGIAFIIYIFIQQNTYKIHYMNYFLKLQFWIIEIEIS